MPVGTSSLIMAMSSAGGAYSGAQARKAQGAFQESVSQTNSLFARKEAEDEMNRGEKAARRVQTEAKKVQGAQRAALAAQGVDLNSGDALDIQKETQIMAAEDEKTARTNAIRAAWGHEASALASTSQGKFAKMAADNEARNTILTGGMQALGYGMEGYEKRQKAKADSSRGGS